MGSGGSGGVSGGGASVGYLEPVGSGPTAGIGSVVPVLLPVHC